MKNKENLVSHAKLVCENLRPKRGENVCENLVSSMPKRLESVIVNKGSHTKH